MVQIWNALGMARFGGLESYCRSKAQGARVLLCVAGLLAVWSGSVLAAQQVQASPEVPTPQDEPIRTLHVYANLIQIPTLVLDPNRERLKSPIAESRFSVSIDNGPWFRATHVRLEADDPISLSIVLDISGDTAKLMPKVSDVIADLAPLSLREKDHVSIYALDCSLMQSLNDVPAERARLKTGVDEVLQSWVIRRQSKQDCEQSVHLWDALEQITGELSKLPGRRVLLAVTDGQDRGSRTTWNEARNLAEARGVAVFGLSYIPQYAKDANHRFLRWSSEDPFHSVCELSGGMVFLSDTRSFGRALKAFVSTVRGRYIVEFPRPAHATPGVHVKEIRIVKSNDFIRPAGISVPIPDAAVLADPTTVIPTDPVSTPELGKRAPMKRPQ
jgi:hypothetical protein